LKTSTFIFLCVFIFLVTTLASLAIGALILSVYGQEKEAKPEAVVTPTPVPTPTPTSPEPNLQYLPQKAYVQSYAPENGIPTNGAPLQVVPQTVPVQSNSIGGVNIDSALSVLSMIVSAGSGFAAKLGFDKAKKAQNTSQENAETNVKQAAIQQKTLEQVYENMPDKGASIQDKPEIKLEEVAKVKDEALKTASKA
jgi:hypothetical protein